MYQTSKSYRLRAIVVSFLFIGILSNSNRFPTLMKLTVTLWYLVPGTTNIHWSDKSREKKPCILQFADRLPPALPVLAQNIAPPPPPSWGCVKHVSPQEGSRAPPRLPRAQRKRLSLTQSVQTWGRYSSSNRSRTTSTAVVSARKAASQRSARYNFLTARPGQTDIR